MKEVCRTEKKCMICTVAVSVCMYVLVIVLGSFMFNDYVIK